MTTEEKTLLFVLTGGAVGVPAVLALLLGWPWLLLILVSPLIPFQVRRTMRYRAQQAELQRAQQDELRRQQVAPPPQLEQAPPPPRFPSDTVANVPLPSAIPDYDFLFSATVCWREIPSPAGWRHANPAALAIDAIVARATEVTVQEPPYRYTLGQFRLSSALGTVRGDSSGLVEAWATHVQLGVSDTDLVRLQKMAELRKDEVLWEEERERERNKRAYLANDVLKDTGSAVVWWLARADTDINLSGTADIVAALARLCAVVNNIEVPEVLHAEASREAPLADAIPEQNSSGTWDGHGRPGPSHVDRSLRQ
ncbi:MAG TPA: hypothetical protein VGL06_15195 [Pseudonocardiaceae bacterium]|jgi:hypothetical protein